MGLVVGDTEAQPGSSPVYLSDAARNASLTLPSGGVNVDQLVQDLKELASAFDGVLQSAPAELDSVQVGLTIGTDGILKVVGVNAQGSITLTIKRA
ncbi:MAG: hypothetical protein ACLQHS_05555 [Candidatus Limnocylindrales bacterium]